MRWNFGARRNAAAGALVAAAVVAAAGCDSTPPLDPATAVLKARIEIVGTDHAAKAIATDNGFVFAAGGEGLMVIDPGEGTDAAWITRLQGGQWPWRLAVCEGHLLAFGGQEATGFYDVSDAENVRYVDSYSNRGGATSMQCIGRRVYVARPQSLDVWELESATTMSFVTELKFPDNDLQALVVAAPYAYVAVEDGLAVVDVSKTPPALVTTVPAPAATRLALLKGRLHGASPTSFFTMDLSSPAAPVLLAESTAEATKKPVGLATWGDWLVRSDPAGDTVFLAMDDPKAPVEKARLKEPFSTFASDESFLYLGNDQGVAVFGN